MNALALRALLRRSGDILYEVARGFGTVHVESLVKGELIPETGLWPWRETPAGIRTGLAVPLPLQAPCRGGRRQAGTQSAHGLTGLRRHLGRLEIARDVAGAVAGDRGRDVALRWKWE